MPIGTGAFLELTQRFATSEERRVPYVQRESLWSRSFTISHIHMGK